MPNPIPYSSTEKAQVVSLQSSLTAAQTSLLTTQNQIAAAAYKAAVGPFYMGPSLAVTAGATNPSGIANGFNAASFPFLSPFAGSVVAISGFAYATAPSTVTLTSVKNGAATAANASNVITTGGNPIRSLFTKGTYPFVATDNLRIDVLSSASVSLSAVFYLLVEFTP